MARVGSTSAGDSPRTTLARETGRGFVFAIGYFASAIVSALTAAASHTAWAYLAEGAESRAGLSSAEMLAHAGRLTALTAAIILALSVPVAWLPLSVTLALARRVQRNRLVACLASGATTGAILAVWILAILSHVSPDDGDRMPFWGVVASNLGFAVPAGAVGGLVLWAVWYRVLPRATQSG